MRHVHRAPFVLASALGLTALLAAATGPAAPAGTAAPAGFAAPAALAGNALPAGPAAPRAPGEPPRYVLDPVHACAVFKVRHVELSNFYGTFDSIAGELAFDDDDLEHSAIAISIAADSVDTNNGRRDGHVKSPDFLNAAEFPEITFVSTAIERTGDDAYSVTGQVGFRGQTREVTAAVVKTGAVSSPQDDRVAFEATFAVDMAAFRVPFVEQNGEGPVGRSVQFTVTGEFVRA